MNSQNPALLALKFAVKDIVGDVLYWPVWWYSRGLIDFLKRRGKSIRSFEEETGLTVWVVNWGKPMYGQYDIAGKLISFVVRTAGIFFKALELIFFLIVELIFIVLWVALPPFVVFELISQLI